MSGPARAAKALAACRECAGKGIGWTVGAVAERALGDRYRPREGGSLLQGAKYDEDGVLGSDGVLGVGWGVGRAELV